VDRQLQSRFTPVPTALQDDLMTIVAVQDSDADPRADQDHSLPEVEEPVLYSIPAIAAAYHINRGESKDDGHGHSALQLDVVDLAQ
jgi:hypothetical protein